LVNTCCTCGDEFIADAVWKRTCLACFKKYQDAGRDACRSPRCMGETLWKTGKHTGRTFQEVEVEDPEYVRWALALENPSRQVAAFAAWLKGAQSPFKRKPEVPQDPEVPEAREVNTKLKDAQHLAMKASSVGVAPCGISTTMRYHFWMSLRRIAPMECPQLLCISRQWLPCCYGMLDSVETG
jgi:hypothetical protein